MCSCDGIDRRAMNDARATFETSSVRNPTESRHIESALVTCEDNRVTILILRSSVIPASLKTNEREHSVSLFTEEIWV